MATKKSTLKQQYNRQINRIKKGYYDIEIRGGSFSKSLNEIIKPVKNPTEATIRRLKSITKESLYRQATTDTGKSGYSILAERRTKAGRKGAIERQYHQSFKNSYDYYRNKDYYENNPNEYRIYYNKWKEEHFESYYRAQGRLGRHDENYDRYVVKKSEDKLLESSKKLYDLVTSSQSYLIYLSQGGKPIENYDFDEYYKWLDDYTKERYESSIEDNYSGNTYSYSEDSDYDSGYTYYDEEESFMDLTANDESDFIEIQMNNIYETLDKMEDQSFADHLRENLDEAVLGGMDINEQVEFLTDHSSELMEAIEMEAKYRNSKDGDIRNNFFGANHFHNKALSIIWGGDIPLSATL